MLQVADLFGVGEPLLSFYSSGSVSENFFDSIYHGSGTVINYGSGSTKVHN